MDETPKDLGMQSYIANEISEAAFFDLDFPVQRIGPENIPIPYSPPLEDEVLATTDDIVDDIELLAKQ